MLAALLAGGCALLNPTRAAEHAIVQYLAQDIGPAREYRVHISPQSLDDLQRGRIHHLTVDALDLRPPGGPVFDEVRAQMEGVQVDRRRHVLRSVERSQVEATLSQAAATAFVASRHPGLADLNLIFAPDGMVVSTAPQALGFRLPIRVTGTASVTPDGAVLFHPDALQVAQLNLPPFIVRFVEKAINPVFRPGDLKLPIHLEGVTLGAGFALLTGRVSLPAVN